MTAVKKLQLTNCSPTLMLGIGGTAVKKLQITNCSHSPQKQSCTAEAEAKLHNPEICVSLNYRANHVFATSLLLLFSK